MAIPHEITFRDGLENTEALNAKIEKNIEKLGRFFHRIESCKVVVDIQQKKQSQGKLFHISIEVLVPGKKLIANKHANQDLYVSIRDAFDAMNKQLQDYAAHIRGEVKVHTESLQGVVARIFDDYGFIRSIDGREFYFHAPNVMSPGFDCLDIGSKVRFTESDMVGETLQANHVIVMGDVTE